ncbi:MAG: hypothetical protein FWH03_05585 [Firmicutes bacterium]|nr:hypothetical protein [Bacillota bacterium]
MKAEEFVTIFKKHKDNMLNCYLTTFDTKVSKFITDLRLNKEQMLILEKLIDTLLTDSYYTMLLGLDGVANIGGIQQTYKIYDEKGNLISDCGDIEVAAYEVFHGD